MYCNTLARIAEKRAETVSQYSLVYCGRKAAVGKIVSQYSSLYCDRGHGRWARRRWASERGAHGARGRSAGERTTILPCWPATRPRGQLRHGHDCCDKAPVRAVRAAMRGLGAGWAC